MKDCWYCDKQHDRSDDYCSDDCESNAAEAAYERQCEDYYGGSGPLSLHEQLVAAKELK